MRLTTDLLYFSTMWVQHIWWRQPVGKKMFGTGLPHTLIFGFGYVTIRRIIGPDVNTRINTHSVNTFLHRNNGNRR